MRIMDGSGANLAVMCIFIYYLRFDTKKLKILVLKMNKRELIVFCF